jgi:hypothetical protein
MVSTMRIFCACVKGWFMAEVKRWWSWLVLAVSFDLDQSSVESMPARQQGSSHNQSNLSIT